MKLPKFNGWYIVAIVSTIIAAGTKFVGDLVSDQETDEKEEKKEEE